MKFSYKARTKEGELQVGNVEAETQEAAANILLGHGLFVLSLNTEKEGSALDRMTSFFRKVKLNDLMIFTRQFSTLLASQVPLADSLTNLYRQTPNPILKDTIADIVSDVEAGRSLSQALARHEEVFTEFYINMVRSAEVTGRLSETFEFLADYLEHQSELTSKVKNALYYPAFVVGLFFVVVIVMVTFVLPQIIPIFEESNVPLPFLTSVLLAGGTFIATWWWAVLLMLFMFALGLVDYFQSPEGKVVRAEIVLKVPVVGGLYRKLYISRFAESARVLIRGGLTIPQAIEISSHTIGNIVYQEALHKASDELRRGRLLSQAIAELPAEFPPLVSQLISVGESTGRLELLLEKVGKFYAREVNGVVDNLVNLIQPILMVVLGVMVALLFASILMPIYNLSQSIGGGV